MNQSYSGDSLPRIEEIENAVAPLPVEESGKLDFFVKEAMEGKNWGDLRDP